MVQLRGPSTNATLQLIKRPGANKHQTWDETLQCVGAVIVALLYRSDRHIVPDLASDSHVPT